MKYYITIIIKSQYTTNDTNIPLPHQFSNELKYFIVLWKHNQICNNIHCKSSSSAAYKKYVCPYCEFLLSKILIDTLTKIENKIHFCSIHFILNKIENTNEINHYGFLNDYREFLDTSLSYFQTLPVGEA